MLPGLQQGQEKMSKSDPLSAIFMEDEEVTWPLFIVYKSREEFLQLLTSFECFVILRLKLM